jgi:glutamine synthetase
VTLPASSGQRQPHLTEEITVHDFTGQANPAAGRLASNGHAGPDGHVAVLKPIGAALTAAGLARRAGDARALAESLPALGVSAVAITIVDNAGIARVKAVPVTGLEHAARWGVGMSRVYGVATVDELFTASATVGGPGGDLRLMPDPSALRIVGAQPGWAWAPADQYTQDGRVFACCQRSYARRMTELAGLRNLEIRVGSEIEWVLGRDEHGTFTPAHAGPGYGFAVLAGLADYVSGLITALSNSGVRIGQFHPEYAPGQLEISLPSAGPVQAADLNVFARHTIRAHSARHGWRSSFSPTVVPGQVGNGGHLHLSVWQHGRNLLAGGDGPYGMTDAGESFLAGVLDQLPVLTAIGAPSAASYLRLQPSRWAGAFACWGHENREAALRFITGMTGSQAEAANFEIKCFDQAANPYLAIGSVIAAGLAGLDKRLRLPPEVTGDPAGSSAAGRLPESLDQALAALRRSEVIPAAMGPVLYDAFTAVRAAEAETFGGQDPATITAAHRWLY